MGLCCLKKLEDGVKFTKRKCTNCSLEFYAVGFDMCSMCWPERESQKGQQRVRLERQANELLRKASKKKSSDARQRKQPLPIECHGPT